MSINVSTSFTVGDGSPIDIRQVIAGRTTLSVAMAYQGLVVYDSMDDTLYVLNDATTPGSVDSWEEVGTGAGGGGATTISQTYTFTGVNVDQSATATTDTLTFANTADATEFERVLPEEGSVVLTINSINATFNNAAAFVRSAAIVTYTRSATATGIVPADATSVDVVITAAIPATELIAGDNIEFEETSAGAFTITGPNTPVDGTPPTSWDDLALDTDLPRADFEEEYPMVTTSTSTIAGNQVHNITFENIADATRFFNGLDERAGADAVVRLGDVTYTFSNASGFTRDDDQVEYTIRAGNTLTPGTWPTNTEEVTLIQLATEELRVIREGETIIFERTNEDEIQIDVNEAALRLTDDNLPGNVLYEGDANLSLNISSGSATDPVTVVNNQILNVVGNRELRVLGDNIRELRIPYYRPDVNIDFSAFFPTPAFTEPINVGSVDDGVSDDIVKLTGSIGWELDLPFTFTTAGQNHTVTIPSININAHNPTTAALVAAGRHYAVLAYDEWNIYLHNTTPARITDDLVYDVIGYQFKTDGVISRNFSGDIDDVRVNEDGEIYVIRDVQEDLRITQAEKNRIDDLPVRLATYDFETGVPVVRSTTALLPLELDGLDVSFAFQNEQGVRIFPDAILGFDQVFFNNGTINTAAAYPHVTYELYVDAPAAGEDELQRGTSFFTTQSSTPAPAPTTTAEANALGRMVLRSNRTVNLTSTRQGRFLIFELENEQALLDLLDLTATNASHTLSQRRSGSNRYAIYTPGTISDGEYTSVIITQAGLDRFVHFRRPTDAQNFRDELVASIGSDNTAVFTYDRTDYTITDAHLADTISLNLVDATVALRNVTPEPEAIEVLNTSISNVSIGIDETSVGITFASEAERNLIIDTFTRGTGPVILRQTGTTDGTIFYFFQDRSKFTHSYSVNTTLLSYNRFLGEFFRTRTVTGDPAVTVPLEGPISSINATRDLSVDAVEPDTAGAFAWRFLYDDIIQFDAGNNHWLRVDFGETNVSAHYIDETGTEQSFQISDAPGFPAPGTTVTPNPIDETTEDPVEATDTIQTATVGNTTYDFSAAEIRGVDVSATAPTNGQVLTASVEPATTPTTTILVSGTDSTYPTPTNNTFQLADGDVENLVIATSNVGSVIFTDLVAGTDYTIAGNVVTFTVTTGAISPGQTDGDRVRFIYNSVVTELEWVAADPTTGGDVDNIQRRELPDRDVVPDDGDVIVYNETTEDWEYGRPSADVFTDSSLSGAGTEANPFSVLISVDDDNTIAPGSDGGLYNSGLGGSRATASFLVEGTSTQLDTSDFAADISISSANSDVTDPNTEVLTEVGQSFTFSQPGNNAIENSFYGGAQPVSTGTPTGYTAARPIGWAAGDIGTGEWRAEIDISQGPSGAAFTNRQNSGIGFIHVPAVSFPETGRADLPSGTKIVIGSYLPEINFGPMPTGFNRPDLINFSHYQKYDTSGNPTNIYMFYVSSAGDLGTNPNLNFANAPGNADVLEGSAITTAAQNGLGYTINGNNAGHRTSIKAPSGSWVPVKLFHSAATASAHNVLLGFSDIPAEINATVAAGDPLTALRPIALSRSGYVPINSLGPENIVFLEHTSNSSSSNGIAPNITESTFFHNYLYTPEAGTDLVGRLSQLTFIPSLQTRYQMLDLGDSRMNNRFDITARPFYNSAGVLNPNGSVLFASINTSRGVLRVGAGSFASLPTLSGSGAVTSQREIPIYTVNVTPLATFPGLDPATPITFTYRPTQAQINSGTFTLGQAMVAILNSIATAYNTRTTDYGEALSTANVAGFELLLTRDPNHLPTPVTFSQGGGAYTTTITETYASPTLQADATNARYNLALAFNAGAGETDIVQLVYAHPLLSPREIGGTPVPGGTITEAIQLGNNETASQTIDRLIATINSDPEVEPFLFAGRVPGQDIITIATDSPAGHAEDFIQFLRAGTNTLLQTFTRLSEFQGRNPTLISSDASITITPVRSNTTSTTINALDLSSASGSAEALSHAQAWAVSSTGRTDATYTEPDTLPTIGGTQVTGIIKYDNVIIGNPGDGSYNFLLSGTWYEFQGVRFTTPTTGDTDPVTTLVSDPLGSVYSRSDTTLLDAIPAF